MNGSQCLAGKARNWIFELAEKQDEIERVSARIDESPACLKKQLILENGVCFRVKTARSCSKTPESSDRCLPV